VHHPLKLRDTQSVGEEIANSVSHGVGLIASVAAAPLLIHAALARGHLSDTIGATVFAVTVVLLYLASSLYHALPHGKAKRVFQTLDHGAILLLIAGTYTPFTLGVLRGAFGWTLLGLVWGLALIGIALAAISGAAYTRLSTALYLGMGWLVLVAIRPLWHGVPLSGLLWLLGGGVAYTVGVGFFSAKRMPYRHLVWHLFVLAGSFCHFVAVYAYAA
jgi:hemolysin III